LDPDRSRRGRLRDLLPGRRRAGGDCPLPPALGLGDRLPDLDPPGRRPLPGLRPRRQAGMSPALAQLGAALGILVAAIGFDGYCLRDLARADVTFVFPPELWFLTIVLTTPFGGIAYLRLGRRR